MTVLHICVVVLFVVCLWFDFVSCKGSVLVWRDKSEKSGDYSLGVELSVLGFWLGRMNGEFCETCVDGQDTKSGITMDT